MITACPVPVLFPEPAPGWVGWRKPNKATARRVWVRVCEAPTEHGCWEKVYAIMNGPNAASSSWAVLKEGERP